MAAPPSCLALPPNGGGDATQRPAWRARTATTNPVVKSLKVGPGSWGSIWDPNVDPNPRLQTRLVSAGRLPPLLGTYQQLPAASKGHFILGLHLPSKYEAWFSPLPQ